MDSKLAKIYYGSGGYWKGIAAIKKLSAAAKVPEDTAKKWYPGFSEDLQARSPQMAATAAG